MRRQPVQGDFGMALITLRKHLAGTDSKRGKEIECAMPHEGSRPTSFVSGTTRAVYCFASQLLLQASADTFDASPSY
jgi:hypothetical protein